MTKQELKIILKIIDMRTTEREVSYQSYQKAIYNPEALKKDIIELFDDSKEIQE